MSKIKKFETPKKTKEEINTERFWNSCPTRKEISQYVDNALQHRLEQVISAIDLSMMGIQEVLVEKCICTSEDFSNKLKSIEERLAKASKEQLEAVADEVKPKAEVSEDKA